MRRYLYKLLIFLIILFVVLLCADYGMSALIRTSNEGMAEAWRDLVEGNIDSDVVVSGSSRALVQVDPEIIDSILCVNSYNLGMNGSPINRQMQKYEIFRERNSKPKLIIQNIDAWSLSYRIGYEKEQFFPFFWDKYLKNEFSRTEPFSFGEKFIPYYRFKGMKMSEFLHSNPRSLYKGYRGHNKKWDGKAYEQQDSIIFAVSDTTARMFDSFLRQAKDENIKVVFVYAPLYFGATRKIINIDDMYRTYKSYADKYDIPVLDFTNMWISYDTTYFYNAMHLNKTGAEIYTDSLANAIKRLCIL